MAKKCRVKRRDIMSDLWWGFYQAMIELHRPGVKSIEQVINSVKMRNGRIARVSVVLSK